jgi:hypothetical protein
MSSYGDQVAKLSDDFRKQEEKRREARSQEDRKLEQARDEKLWQLKFKYDKEQKEMITGFKKKDLMRSQSRILEDQTLKSYQGQAILDLSCPSVTPSSSSPNKALSTPGVPTSNIRLTTPSGTTPTAEPSTNPRGTKRPMSPDEQPAPAELSPFEKRRNENMANNMGILNNIAPLIQKAPKVQQRRGGSTATAEISERRQSLGRAAKDHENQNKAGDAWPDNSTIALVL